MNWVQEIAETIVVLIMCGSYIMFGIGGLVVATVLLVSVLLLPWGKKEDKK